MDKKRTYFGKTTPQQRRLLFEAWEKTGSITRACQTSRVSRHTFYDWQPRFEANGYAGLESFESSAPKHHVKTRPEVEQRVIAMHRNHPNWGKQRIADELAKENNWGPLVTVNPVRRILRDAGLWNASKPGISKKTAVVRTADAPGQTLNIALCFVPCTHQPEQKLPAVSGSSGRLVIERAPAAPSEQDWPGRVFEHQELDYSEAMLQFVARSQTQDASANVAETAAMREQRALKAQKRQFHRQEAQVRDERRIVRQQRPQEDEAWKHLNTQRRQQQQARRTPVERRAQDEQWRAVRQQRRETQEHRTTEDARWRQQRRDFKELWGQLPHISDWVAILVTTDNCTRQCLG